MKKNNPHEGHRSRLKERFLNEGLESFEEHNVMELMLFYGIPYKDTNDIAHDLINKFNSFERVLEAPIESLVEVKGVGENTAIMIKLFHAVAKYYDEKKHQLQVRLSKPDDIIDFMKAHCRYRKEEIFTVIALDGDCRYLAYEDISFGSAGITEVNIRKAVNFLLRNNAACAIATHNHPSGMLSASVDDMTATRKLFDALDIVDIHLLDHIIIGNDDYLSMRTQANYTSIFTKKA